MFSKAYVLKLRPKLGAIRRQWEPQEAGPGVRSPDHQGWVLLVICRTSVSSYLSFTPKPQNKESPMYFLPMYLSLEAQ